MNVYVVIGRQKKETPVLCDEYYDDDVYGVFSTEELAEECCNTLTKELTYLECCLVEEVELDAFGHR